MNKQVSHIPSGYKPSPLGPIPEDWEVKRLGYLCENKGDYGLNAPATDYSVNLPTYLRITDIDDNGNFIHSAKKSVDNLSAKEYYLKDGDIVFARTGATVGKTYLYDVRDGQLVYAGFLIKFSPNPNKLIPYYLKAHTETKDYTNWVAITSQRSGQPGINAAEYCSLKLAIPPIEEQERICNVLQLWDTAIAKQTASIEKLTLRKRGLMQQLLTGKKRLKGFGGEWKEVRLGEIARITMGQSPDSKYYNEIGLGLPLIQGNADIQDKKSIQRFWTSNITKTCEGGDIIMSVRAPVGEIAIATQKSCIGRGVCAIKNTSIEKKYLYQLLLFEEDSWKNIEQGGTFTAINSNEIRNKAVIIPATDEQNAIASVLVDADKEIEIQKQKLAAMQEEKKGLMQVLLTGKKRIK